MFHIHRWGRWRVTRYYIDISWGSSAKSTEMIRECKGCGLVQKKHYYGTVIPMESERAS